MGKRRLTVFGVVAISALIPGAVHFRLGALWGGLTYLGAAALLTAVQVAAPIFERPALAALVSGTAFGLGWVVSALAARSAAQLV